MAQSVVNLVWIGLFVLFLGRISTGASFSASRSTESNFLTILYHFVPHLSCKLLIVKRKLKGRTSTLVLDSQNTSACG